MLLIGQCDSPYVRRVAVSLHLLGVPFERAPLSAFREVERMRERNPTLRVPALVLDDGALLTDSTAILDWLDQEVGPTRALLPPAGSARRRCWQLIALAFTACDKAKDCLYEIRLRPPEKVHEPWLARCAGQLAAALDAFERAAPHPWLLGERLSQADITVACAVDFIAGTWRDAVPVGRHPTLGRLSAACEALPAFVACRPGAAERPIGEA